MILEAYAKINLTLDIVGKREDGYHLIDSLFQSVGVFDTVKVEKADKISVCCDDLNGEENIAFKAAREFFRYTSLNGGAKIVIEKRIPVRAGLGGGSADAAAVIVALNRIYNVGLSLNELAKIGICCGADVPFFIYGGTARVGGIGEKITPLSLVSGFCILLIKKGEKQSTADMYKKLDGLPLKDNKTDEFLRVLEQKGAAEALKHTGNAFNSVGADKSLIKMLEAQKPICVSLSGSGPMHFAVFNDENSASKAAVAFENCGFKPLVAPFADCSIKIIE